MQNEFITALGLAEWEDEVVALLEKYNVPEPEDEIEEDDEAYGRDTKDDLINFIFDKDCATSKQKARQAEENFYLETIKFNFDLRYYKKDIASVDIPFGIDEKSDYASVVDTIGEPHLQTDDYELSHPYLIKFWLLKKEDGERYLVRIYFKTETLKVHTMALVTYDEEHDYWLLEPHSYDPLKK